MESKMRKVWIVVANSTQAKIYQAESANKLVEKKFMEHVEGHLRASELVSDGQGRTTNTQMFGSDTYQAKTPVKMKEAIRFSDQIVEFLENIYNSGDCERLYIIAKAPFLSHLRDSLSPNLAKLVHKEIGKDLTQLTADQVREYLPPAI